MGRCYVKAFFNCRVGFERSFSLPDLPLHPSGTFKTTPAPRLSKRCRSRKSQGKVPITKKLTVPKKQKYNWRPWEPSPFMQLVGLVKLDDFKRKHADSRGALDAWQVLVERAHWTGPQDIKNWQPSASFLANHRVIFNIKGNTYRLVIKVRYQNKLVVIEWVGTHAEYDKKSFNA
jgi:mRNA interferase HigB